MDKPSTDKTLAESTRSSPEKRPTRRPPQGGMPRPEIEDVVRLEHERHKHLMDLLAK